MQTRMDATDALNMGPDPALGTVNVGRAAGQPPRPSVVGSFDCAPAVLVDSDFAPPAPPLADPELFEAVVVLLLLDRITPAATPTPATTVTTAAIEPKRARRVRRSASARLIT